MTEDDRSLAGLAGEQIAQLAEIIPHPNAMPGQRHQEVTVNIPGAESWGLRSWAYAIEAMNPMYASQHGEVAPCGINVTDEPFMGVELTIAAAGRPLLTLTLFGDRPNDEERNIMETNNDGTAGL